LAFKSFQNNLEQLQLKELLLQEQLVHQPQPGFLKIKLYFAIQIILQIIYFFNRTTPKPAPKISKDDEGEGYNYPKPAVRLDLPTR
jgi:hypothetical protein